jgi:NAD(P)-dependent dehydrogenase (short-subunit alcohol dehydrogenase family)
MQLSGRVVLVTGGTSNIGNAAALEFAERGASVVVVGRDTPRSREAVEAVRLVGNERVRFVPTDLSVQSDVRALAETVHREYDRLDVLVNGAGTFRRERQLSPDGIEETLAVNYLAPYLLTRLLTDRLVESGGQVLNLTASAHRNADSVLDDLNGAREYSLFSSYARSKLALVLFTVELADRLADTDVTVNGYHPGLVPTGREAERMPLPIRLAFGVFRRLPLPFTRTAEACGVEVVRLTTDERFTSVSGRYYEGVERGETHPAVNDRDIRDRLWTESAELVGLPTELDIGTASGT